MSKYSDYNNTGVKWLPEIPAEWEMAKINDLFVQRKEKVSDREYPPLSVTKNGIVPQLANAAKSNDGDNRKLVCSGDFVINSRSDRKGSSGVSQYDGSVSLINIVLTPRKGLNNRFIHYLLRSHYFIEEYYRNGRGIVADLWTTRYSEMKTIYIPIPSDDEQDQIVRYLDWQVSRINKLINAKKKQIELLEEQKKIVITETVTKGLYSDVKMKDSEISWIGSIPSHWNIVTLKHCAKIKSGITLGKKYPPNTELISLPYLRVANVQNGYVDTSNVATISVTPYEAEKYKLQKGMVVMTEGGDRDKLGRGCVWNGEIDPCLHQNHIFAVTVDEERFNKYFLEYLTISQVGREYFDITATKTTNLACTNASKVMAFAFPYPPLKEQNDIVAYLRSALQPIDNAIGNITKIIEYLHEYRTRLISDVVTGQMDVRDVVIPEYEAVEEEINTPHNLDAMED